MDKKRERPPRRKTVYYTGPEYILDPVVHRFRVTYLEKPKDGGRPFMKAKWFAEDQEQKACRFYKEQQRQSKFDRSIQFTDTTTGESLD